MPGQNLGITTIRKPEPTQAATTLFIIKMIGQGQIFVISFVLSNMSINNKVMAILFKIQ